MNEQHALWLSAGVALLMGGVGIGAALWTDSQAIMLDGLFNAAYFVTALATLYIASLLRPPDSDDYPVGYSYFEPLINGIKGLLILGISMLALVDALDSILEGGRLIEVGPAIGYAIFATVVCTLTALILHRAGSSTGSPLLLTDAASWGVSAAIWAAVLLAFCAIPVLESQGEDDLVPYVDPTLVAIVVLISIAVPIRMAGSAIMALLNRAPPAEVRGPVLGAVKAVLAKFEPQSVYVRMLQPGRAMNVAVHVVLPKDGVLGDLEVQDAMRSELYSAVARLHAPVVVDVVFTCDERWAAPAAIS